MDSNYEEIVAIADKKVTVHYVIKCFGIEFAPINVPFQRRLQTFAVGTWFTCIFLGLFINLYVMFTGLISIYFSWIPIFYAYWIYRDMGNALTGARKINFIRHLRIWKYIRDYFPINLIKTADLPPTSNYLFCVHPHGISSVGMLINFGTEANNFQKLYRGLDPYFLISFIMFFIPFTREIITSLGGCSVFDVCLLNLLSDPAGGKVAVASAGGILEMLNAKPFNYEFVPNYQMIQVAVKSGASIVPVISFGENDIYNQINNKYVNKLAEWIEILFHFKPNFLIGRGFWQYTFGIIPHRRPITTIVGKPIAVTQIPDPAVEEVYQYYNEFKTRLEELFNEYKGRYTEYPDKVQLHIK